MERPAFAFGSMERPAFAFGLIGDVQYMDEDDGKKHNHPYHTGQSGHVRKHYRGALTVLAKAVNYFDAFSEPLRENCCTTCMAARHHVTSDHLTRHVSRVSSVQISRQNLTKLS